MDREREAEKAILRRKIERLQYIGDVLKKVLVVVGVLCFFFVLYRNVLQIKFIQQIFLWLYHLSVRIKNKHPYLISLIAFFGTFVIRIFVMPQLMFVVMITSIQQNMFLSYFVFFAGFNLASISVYFIVKQWRDRLISKFDKNIIFRVFKENIHK